MNVYTFNFINETLNITLAINSDIQGVVIFGETSTVIAEDKDKAKELLVNYLKNNLV